MFGIDNSLNESHNVSEFSQSSARLRIIKEVLRGLNGRIRAGIIGEIRRLSPQEGYFKFESLSLCHLIPITLAHNLLA